MVIQNKKKRAFTLIELLVVISIIALLMAVLMPSLQKARELAKATVCMSGMKNIGLCISFYAEDNNQYIPPAWDKNDPTAGIERYWIGKIMPYVLRAQGGTKPEVQQWMESKVANVFICPSAPPYSASKAIEKSTMSDYGDMWSKCVGMRNWMKPGSAIQRASADGYFEYKKLTDIRRQSEFFLVSDSLCVGAGKQYQWYAITPSSQEPDPYASGDGVWSIDMRHSKKANMVFADSHVEKVTPDYIENDVSKQDDYIQFSRGGDLRIRYYLREKHGE